MAIVTHELAEFIADFGVDKVPSPVIDRAALCMLDVIAAAVGGALTRNARQTRGAASSLFGGGTVPIWFTGARSRAGGAVLANCAAASALDIDDGHRGAAGHPGAAIVPAVLGDAFVSASDGRRLLAAVALGYDVALRVASARRTDQSISYAAGRWCGFGVVAALGWLRELSRDKLANALAIAGAEAPQNLPQGASQRMGSVKGSSPWATLTALAAVERAEQGATGPDDLLDLDAMYDSKRIVADLGGRWPIMETYLKPYAACRYCHPAIDAVIAMSNGRPMSVRDIDELTVEIFPEAQKITNDRVPQTLEAAQFSIPFTVALAALRGEGALRPLDEDSLRDSEVLDLSRRVRLDFADGFAGQFPRRTPARVTVRRGSRVESRTVHSPLGDPDNPMDARDVESKLRDLAHGFLSDTHVEGLLRGIEDMRAGSPERLLAGLAMPTSIPEPA